MIGIATEKLRTARGLIWESANAGVPQRAIDTIVQRVWRQPDCVQKIRSGACRLEAVDSCASINIAVGLYEHDALCLNPDRNELCES